MYSSTDAYQAALATGVMNNDLANKYAEYYRKKSRAIRTGRLQASGVDSGRSKVYQSEFAVQRKIRNIARLAPPQARLFAAGLRHLNLSSRSIARTLSAARSFYKFLIREGEGKTNPFEGISTPRGERKLPRTLNIEQAAQLVMITPDSDLTFRDRAIL